MSSPKNSPGEARKQNGSRKRKRPSSLDSDANGASKYKSCRVAPRDPAAFYKPDLTISPSEDQPVGDLEPITLKDAKDGKATRPIRVYADGVYDVYHFGHARALMQAKRAFPTEVYLMVGVSNDELTHQYKGFTVMTEDERYESLRHCRYVDEVIRDAPWSVTPDFMELHKIDFVAHDDLPYKSAGADDIYKEVKAMGKFVATQRTEGISTSDLIARVVKDYDVYIRRNLARGYTAKELNVSFIKEKEVQVRQKMDEIKGKLTDKSQEILQKWEEKSRDFIGSFIDMFGRDGRLNQLFGKGKDTIYDAGARIKGAGVRIKRALSPGRNMDLSDDVSPSCSPSSSPKVPRLSLDPEISDDEDDEIDDNYVSGQKVNLAV
ncbi:choline-phosphate cytidylyltransferase A-like [Orbicella faveolata]|uniref:choline-phosphate cytidylyltransferase A-like n=1 Tax=Orbicella faveolata TaxID=48498 RepID=UPI0009E36900|nr:choline-phosphate cytidylyltransferase A-like [Orbicella faveolata]